MANWTHVEKQLSKHPRFIAHFTPTTSASWQNIAEHILRDARSIALTQGIDIKDEVIVYNQDSEPFIRTAEATDILLKVSRATRSLRSI